MTVDGVGVLPASANTPEGFNRRGDAPYERKSLAISSNVHPSRLTRPCRKPLPPLRDRRLHHALVIVISGDNRQLSETVNGNGVVA
ncbi:hypothetical protein LO772_30345 [Yinghuangia sp. ASG 101]|uniref:hypothetical protein n=1 Tax=Yinghuangia sp. ASG 101 TaxID=2896848 RepID=UPI001E567692|nr:hypothetical protein [Yinghuangia sp. ASG 101]UGQ11062.1 hypothetical protein LO772_30345 [Yinghuangia sp. ASG 101]